MARVYHQSSTDYTSKVCPVCLKDKPLSEFYKHSSGNSYQSQCKHCYNRRGTQKKLFQEKQSLRNICHMVTQVDLFPVYSIYALIDPTDQSIRYIGMSSQPEMRLAGHLRASFGRKLRWIRGLQSQGFLPVLKILETTDNKQYALARESYWIHYYAKRNAPLLNRHQILPHKKRLS